MRSLSASLTASSVLLLTACGGGPARPAPPSPIPSALATRLASEAERVARLAADSCAARAAAVSFRADVIARIGRIPARYREPLLSVANDLAARLTACGSGRNGSEMQKKPEASSPGSGIPHFRDPQRQAAAIAAWLRRRSD